MSSYREYFQKNLERYLKKTINPAATLNVQNSQSLSFQINNNLEKKINKQTKNTDIEIAKIYFNKNKILLYTKINKININISN